MVIVRASFRSLVIMLILRVSFSGICRNDDRHGKRDLYRPRDLFHEIIAESEVNHL
jgi:hypothetical protein